MRIGRPPKQKKASPGQKKLHTARVRAARGSPNWTELDEADLVARGDLLVSVATDAVYKRHPGVVFEPGSTTMIADHAPLAFYVNADEPTFLERLPGTWSDEIARQERRHARAVS